MFNNNKNVIGEDINIPAREPKAKSPPPMEHDRPFKPSHPPRTSYTMTFEKFPVYKEDPKAPLTRKMDVDENAPKAFKPTHNTKSTPMPSVQCNLRNIKASFPSVFRR